MKKKLIVIDLSNFIFRAFYAIRPLHAPDGTPVNAVHGVLSMLMKMFSTYHPTHVLIARDTKDGSFRKNIFEAYKANREAPPEELIPQFLLIENLMNKMKLPMLQIPNYEADDIIGSAVTQWKKDFDEIYIASSDKDLMQFVGDQVYMLDTMKSKIYKRDDVFEKMGVWPEQIVDFLSMTGDSSDNIPGMKGIGPKGAADLLEEYKNFENCIKSKDQFTSKRLKTAFDTYLEDGILSKKLVQIITNLDLKVTPDETSFKFYPEKELIEYLKNLGFKSVIEKLQQIAMQESAAIKEQGQFVEEKKTNEFQIIMLESSSDVAKIPDTKNISVYIEYDRALFYQGAVWAIAISTGDNEVYYCSIKSLKSNSDLMLGIIEALITTKFKDEKLNLVCNDCKFLSLLALKLKTKLNCLLFDVEQAFFVLDPGARNGLEYLSQSILGKNLFLLDFKKISFLDYTVEETAQYSASRCQTMIPLYHYLEKKLHEEKLENVYYGIDAKLMPILASMESEGVGINPNYLHSLELKFEKELQDIQTNVEKYSQGTINLNSPKQVAELLFDKLQLPVIKKTKTGNSTDSEVLEELVEQDQSPVPLLILKFRELDKLLSTYIKALPLQISEQTNKIHTHYKLNNAATGRLSSDNPNLQNIPIRTENGRLIRKAFIASPGRLLLSADYSQVELRILAHFSQDPTMVDAFNNDQDIHAQTAAQVLDIPLKEVTSAQRSSAKAVNFGLMYGQSSFGLARTLGISRKEAKEFITKYFERFSKVKMYLDSLKEKCEQTGFAITMFGRKRFLPDIHSNNRTIKSMAERIAVNSPIQGTAADIIKLAMIEIEKEMNQLKSKMILQVHDELIFDVYEEELEFIKTMVKEKMENTVKLSVPLRVDLGTGVNWFDLK